MEPNEALAELLTLSSQIVDVAILGGSGFVLASSASICATPSTAQRAEASPGLPPSPNASIPESSPITQASAGALARPWRAFPRAFSS